MVKLNKGNLIGSWAFLAGVVLAVILGLFNLASGLWLIALIIIGLVVGLLNIAGKEVMPFLLSGVVLVIASSQGNNLLGNVPYVGTILAALMAIFVPATIIVAIKNVFSMAKS